MIQSRVCTQSQQLPGSKPEWSWHHTASCVVHSVMVAPEILSYWSASSDIFVHVRKKKKINVGKNLWWLLSCRMAQNTSWLLLASRSRLWMLYWYNSRCFWHRFFFFLVTYSQYMWFLLFQISQNLEELASIAAFIEFLNSIYLPLYM